LRKRVPSLFLPVPGLKVSFVSLAAVRPAVSAFAVALSKDIARAPPWPCPAAGKEELICITESR
jgi:hypothetical protein